MMNYKLILGSQSPRRQQLMQELGFIFTTRVISIDEDFPEDLAVEQVAEYLAIEKGKAHLDSIAADELVITADTTVVVGQEVLNKPLSAEEARTMLRKLSGCSHHVISGVCLTTQQWQRSFSEQTMVHFASLTAEEISFYVEKYQPLDKAGGYAIQEWIGMIGISGIEGSYFNVVGLPVHQLYQTLKKVILNKG
ncbi:Maf family nucleotide pyrophosphatase [Tunicatimonas pelagia]|uniref:Maf family nucleotide pyrophosphatase n=1 Tax=Tunicatimonas pelagia TaxID=931531 RepID=UPI002666888A|nr:Maf family nucleotide pyrophosphatase [Tunicatimonas pelagia]WKN41980.1 Maf family nucleotide pyrophosphatase [Tunicatimonas pelagia]